jgi:methionyl-tRNA synthetase
MEGTTQKIWRQIGISEGQGTAWEDTLEFGRTPVGTKVQRGEALFPRIDIEKELQELEEANQAYLDKINGNPQTRIEIVPKAEITLEDFDKIEVRAAKVVKAEKHPKADKLLVLQLEVGNGTRQVVSGIAEHYRPEDIVGKTVLLLANLKPVKLRGIESQGMILAASHLDKLVLGTVDGEILPGASLS